eukprot:Nitzschia sp. Nitz4//scaffold250_size28497//2205//4031//NITZ4_008122-RA/size28497-processed-gene-0.14-mRNA-1//-1//CDS//3329544207//2198//frame0
MKSPSIILSLPAELKKQISSYLPSKDAIALASTCKVLSKETVALLPRLRISDKYMRVYSSGHVDEKDGRFIYAGSVVASIPVCFPKGSHSVLITGLTGDFGSHQDNVTVSMFITEQPLPFTNIASSEHMDSVHVVAKMIVPRIEGNRTSAPFALSFVPKPDRSYHMSMQCEASSEGPWSEYREAAVTSVHVHSIVYDPTVRLKLFQTFIDLGWLPQYSPVTPNQREVFHHWSHRLLHEFPTVFNDIDTMLQQMGRTETDDTLRNSIFDAMIPSFQIPEKWQAYMDWCEAFHSETPFEKRRIPPPLPQNIVDSVTRYELELPNILPLVAWPPEESARVLSDLRARLSATISEKLTDIMPIPLLVGTIEFEVGCSQYMLEAKQDDLTIEELVVLELDGGNLDFARVVPRNRIHYAEEDHEMILNLSPTEGCSYLLLAPASPGDYSLYMTIFSGEPKGYAALRSLGELNQLCDEPVVQVLTTFCRLMLKMPIQKNRSETQFGHWWVSKGLPVDNEGILAAIDLMSSLSVYNVKQLPDGTTQHILRGSSPWMYLGREDLEPDPVQHHVFGFGVGGFGFQFGGMWLGDGEDDEDDDDFVHRGEGDFDEEDDEW